MSVKWLYTVGGAVAVAIALQTLATLEILPALVELNPAAVEMWKIALDFLARVAWPFVALTMVWLFAAQIRELIPRLIKFDSPLGSGELSDPNTPFVVGELEGAIKAEEERTPATSTAESDQERMDKVAELDRRRNEIYEAFSDAIGEFGSALLIGLKDLGDRATMAELAARFGVANNTLNRHFRNLMEQSLIWKEGPGHVAKTTQLGRAYLRWLEAERREEFLRAQARWLDLP